MRVHRLLFLLAVLPLLAQPVHSTPAPPDGGRSRPAPGCSAGDKLCAAGSGRWLCVAPRQACPAVYVHTWERPRGHREEGWKWCQVGPDQWIEVPSDQECPEGERRTSLAPGQRPHGGCDPGEKECQIGENEWTCIPADEDCPTLLFVARDPWKCPSGQRRCQTGPDTWECVPDEEACP